MQYVSTAYKEAMKQAARNKSYMRISLGLVNQAAQTAAQVQGGSFTYFLEYRSSLWSEETMKSICNI